MAITRSAGLIVMRQFDGQWRCLILRAYRNWDFPKGRPDSNEDLLEAALRETKEETGLPRPTFPWGGSYRETEAYGKGKVVRIYIAFSRDGQVSLPINASLGRPEHHEFRWVSLHDARQLLPPRFRPILSWAQDVVGPEKAGE
ncbi:bis(5'-nucleosyl)-tetraphosphatase [Cupriavidus pauculus]|uniref:bis(5'-nucleosyl)-tetraphosphatase n=1 Tax=Cupriavidus pauculus TaxID=82633 RepID=UPI000A047543|nr:NUDIX domain-containing protein [Cupriavidus pauculus]